MLNGGNAIGFPFGLIGVFRQSCPALATTTGFRSSAAALPEWFFSYRKQHSSINCTSGANKHVIKLRLRRMGKKKRPSYRIVAAEVTSPRDGRFIETLGHYDPLTEPATIKINSERALHWLSVGAQPTETVAGLLKRAGVTSGEAVAEAKA